MKLMHLFTGLFAVILIFIVLWDVFEAIVLPRRVTRRIRLTRFFYRTVWTPWSAMARRVHKQKRREALLGVFGPLSLVILLGLWATALVFSFAMIHWAIGSNV